MAMNGTSLGDEMLAAIRSLSATDQASAAKCFQKMGEAIVAHIQANATVTIRAADSGLQTSTAIGFATSGPAANKTLPAGCVG
jgi:hypothetical protein